MPMNDVDVESMNNVWGYVLPATLLKEERVEDGDDVVFTLWQKGHPFKTPDALEVLGKFASDSLDWCEFYKFLKSLTLLSLSLQILMNSRSSLASSSATTIRHGHGLRVSHMIVKQLWNLLFWQGPIILAAPIYYTPYIKSNSMTSAESHALVHMLVSRGVSVHKSDHDHNPLLPSVAAPRRLLPR